MKTLCCTSTDKDPNMLKATSSEILPQIRRVFKNRTTKFCMAKQCNRRKYAPLCCSA